MAQRIVALVPAYNEGICIGATIEALLAQTRPLDAIVVIPNGCTDDTADIARSYMNEDNSVIVYELPRLEHKKSQALNMAWNEYARDADIVISVDADTIFDTDAIELWEQDFKGVGRRKRHYKPLGGSAAKATMPKPGFWDRLQKAEFAKSVDASLMRGFTTVLPGAGAAFANAALRRIVNETGREGPWSYESAVEDFELTVQLRMRGYLCIASPHVRMYTDSMSTLRTMWDQRMKWTTGTIEDLLDLGVTRLTLVDWGQQLLGGIMLLVRVLWIMVIILQITSGIFGFHWFWWLVYPLVFICSEAYLSRRMPNPDWKDRALAMSLIPYEIFGWIRAAWFAAAWIEVLSARVTGRRKDRWELQYRAEGVSV